MAAYDHNISEIYKESEGFTPQVNEIPNTMPSWMPGDDYMTNFRKGDPYVKIDEGYARLPGAGYTAIHPELKDVDPEDYPDIVKMRILGDVAPYSGDSVFTTWSLPRAHNKTPARAGEGLPALRSPAASISCSASMSSCPGQLDGPASSSC